jgi:hypothetical protein
MKRSTYCTAAVSALLAACGGGPAGGGWAGSVTDSAGVAVVQNPAVGLWAQGEGPTVTEVLRIGVAEGAPEYQFGQITGVSVDADGQIYVMDSQAQEVRVYDQSGAFRSKIGRPGAGPGELSPAAAAPLFGLGDTLFLPDLVQQRVNLFLRNGTFLRSFRIPFAEGVSVKWATTPERELLQHLRPMPMPGAEPASGAEVVLRRGSDGAIRDTVLAFPASQSVQFRGGALALKLFDAEPGWDLADDGRLFFGTGADYRIEIRSPDGALTRVIHKPFSRQAISEGDRELFRNAIRKALEQQKLPAQAVQMVLQGVAFADHYPAFLHIMGGPEGSLWVRQLPSAERMTAGSGSFSLEDPGATDWNAPDWDVFDRDGRFLGEVRLPSRFQPSRFHGNRLYGVLKDDLDVSYVVALEVRGGFGGDR